MSIENLKQREVDDFKVYYRNEEETRRIIEEVFDAGEYRFSSQKNTPFIIDCGSHIGLSIMYFKKLYPEAEVLGFEPNSENFAILKKNVDENHLDDVRLVEAGVSDIEGEAKLRISSDETDPWTWGDSFVNNIWGDNGTNKEIGVKLVKLSDFIDKQVDFLKIDIEAYEQKVVAELADKLGYVKEMVIEYHLTPTMEVENDYAVIKKILTDKGFNVALWTKSGEKMPEYFVPANNNTNQVYLIKAEKI